MSRDGKLEDELWEKRTSSLRFFRYIVYGGRQRAGCGPTVHSSSDADWGGLHPPTTDQISAFTAGATTSKHDGLRRQPYDGENELLIFPPLFIYLSVGFFYFITRRVRRPNVIDFRALE